jgi:hypothetical protein
MSKMTLGLSAASAVVLHIASVIRPSSKQKDPLTPLINLSTILLLPLVVLIKSFLLFEFNCGGGGVSGHFAPKRRSIRSVLIYSYGADSDLFQESVLFIPS